jgi:cysteine desulfurase
MLKWLNKGNPSAETKEAADCKKLINSFRDAIATDCMFPMDSTPHLSYAVIFTSGASESNSHIVTSVCRAYSLKTGVVPHVITSEVEHKSILMCCEQLVKERALELTKVPVRTSGEFFGTVDPADIAAAIRPNTALITIMTTNNETGANNNVIKIGQIAARHNIAFHSDAVQFFGRSRIRLVEWGIDAISVSFHKLYGPPGIGALIVRKSLVAEYDLQPIVYGTQNYGLRGGTMNTPAIAGAYVGFKYTLENRDSRNVLLRDLRKLFMARIAKRVKAVYIDDFIEGRLNSDRPLVVWLAPKPAVSGDIVVPWTVFMAIRRPGICNVEVKRALEKQGVVISIGSACNTDSDKASHVVYALQIPDELKAGVLRISFGYDTKKEDVLYTADLITNIVLRS